MKILVWKAKHEDLYYDASTLDKELNAFMTVFQLMDEQGDYGCCPPEGKEHKALYRKAKKGDRESARTLLSLRCDYEYEGVFIQEVQEGDENG